MKSSAPKITVFTPTYNRAYIITTLYKSLEAQTFRDFEWLVVDDGSTDNTESLINDFISESKFPIKYFKTSNGGKHRAINYGVKHASGELFYVVDSDDNLPSDSLQIISDEWNNIPIQHRDHLSGLCGERYIYSKKECRFPFECFEGSAQEITYQYKINFDKAEIFRTDILLKFPFPTFENERFVPEAYIWNKITSEYPMHYFHKQIYNADYISDGYTKNFKSNLKRNPKGFGLFYKTIVADSRIPILARLKAFIRLCQCVLNSHSSFFISL